MPCLIHVYALEKRWLNSYHLSIHYVYFTYNNSDNFNQTSVK